MYGICISLGILASTLIAERVAKKIHLNIETLWGLTLWALIGGILGARLYHVLDYFSYYSENIIRIFELNKGGLGIIGAITGGTLSILLFCKNKKIDFKIWMDVASIAVPVGQAIGRWGNYFNKEIFGRPTSLPWGLYIPAERRPDEFVEYSRFHPLFIYESFLNIILFIFLYRTYSQKRFAIGSLVFTHIYILGYSIIRLALETFRITAWRIHGINVTLCICILCALYSVWFLFKVLKLQHDIYRK